MCHTKFVRSLTFTASESGEPGTGGGETVPRTFTQEEVNQIAAAEKDKARRAAERAHAEAWQEQFGDVKPEDIAARLQAIQEAEEAQKSEAEKALDEANRIKAEAEATAAAAAAELHSTRVQAAILAANGDPEKAHQVARLVDADKGASVDEIAEAVNKVKTDFPALFGQKNVPNTDPGNGPASKNGPTDRWAAGRERAKQRFGA